MTRSTIYAFVALCTFCQLGSRAPGQEPVNARAASHSIPKAKIYVAFRMQGWRAKHMHDSAQAQTHIETLRKLGCEVKTAQHDGHTDVSCRTVFWKSMSLDSGEQAQQWISWLQQSGFETIYGRPAGSGPATDAQGKPAEVVQFRLADWHAQHIHDNAELGQLLALYRGLGCEVQTASHGGHTDVKARCPAWMEISLSSHQAAVSWEKFLQDMGFETKHTH